MKGLTSFFFLVFSLPVLALAVEWQRPEAHLEWVHGVRTEDLSDVVVSRIMGDATFAWMTDRVDGLVSVEAVENFRIPDDSDLRFREAYLTGHAGEWEARAGRQILIWGRADGVRIVDRLSPVDTRESVTRELEEIRLGVDALRLNRWLANGEVECIWIPRFHKAKHPGKDSPWLLGEGVPAEEPDGVDAMDLGLRWSRYASALDLSFYGLSTVMDTPVSAGDGNGAYRRTGMVGMDAALPHGDAVWRAEAAWFDGWFWAAKDPGAPAVERDRMMLLAGCDITFEGDRTLRLQGMGDWVLGDTDTVAADSFTPLVTMNLEQKLMRDRLLLTGFVYWYPDAPEVYGRTALDWEVRDGIHLEAGVHLFDGKGDQFGPYRANSQFWGRLTWDW